MRLPFLWKCLTFVFIAAYSHVSYSADFNFDIDRFTQVGGVSGSATFVDEFDNGTELSIWPSGASTYSVLGSFPADAESDGLLNLNGNNADPIGEPVIGASTKDNTYFFNSGSGGRLEGKFRFLDGFGTNTGFIITIHDTPLSELESSSLWIEKEMSGRIVAYFDYWLPDVSTIIGKTDITNLLGTSTDITLRLDVSTTNVVTASLDIGSDGSFDVVMPGSYTLTFPGETKHTGAFIAFKESCLESSLMVNQDGSVDLFMKNNCGESVPTEIKMWSELSGQNISVLNVGFDGSTVWPDELDTSVRIIQPQPSALLNNLIFGLRFLDPVTGEEQCVSRVETP